ncbi:general secretion pathway protein GspK [Methylobacterium sp. J-076]|uniref:general secretion pathway protein GspK n=1 Tax=Methylobacterium sp. J-076 TaxID=2836655 RepID=UPI001FB899F5|nr:type II secretion system protein GspK [Methylobacterium sp. J-076]MCJ2015122.1 general secretion pathway protein GspK [Methylobacterium sp. J-076]
MSAESPHEDGFVLVSVVMVLAAVSAVLATGILQTQAHAALARTRADLAHLQGMADGVARLLAYDLAVGRTYRLVGLGLPEDGTSVACPLGAGRTAVVSLEDQGRLIDLNRTPRPAMEEAFRTLGIQDRDALALSAEIADYRDADDVPEPGGGAELAQYRARGLAYGPRNGPFLSVDEIGRLPSMTPQLAAKLQPALTVYNEGGTFNLAALTRRLNPAAVPSLPASGKGVPSPRQYFRMSVTLVQGTARAGRTGIYALGGSRTGTDFLVWQPGVAAPAPAPAIDHRACGAIRAALLGG